MAGQVTLSLKTEPLRAPEMREALETLEFTFDTAPYAFWRAKGQGCTVTFYQKGKVVLQGQTSHQIAAYLDLTPPEEEEEGEPFEAALAMHPKPAPEAWIGTDETGKGDYFGPLVVVAARLERKHVALAAELGAADSKKLTDKRILAMATDLKRLVTYETVVIGPATYNRLYQKMGNLNRLLAWAHATAIETLLQKAPAEYALTDQFGDRRLIESRLGEAGRSIRFDQRPKAEADPAVAIASILARNEFVWRMRKLSRELGFDLPKGAGAPIQAAGKRILSQAGPDALGSYAKLHFANTKKILG